MTEVDLIDKRILLELSANCRVSYQTLANRLGISVNAVKKRVEKLTEIGAIKGYRVYPSLAMIDAESAMIFLSTKEPVTDERFLDQLGANPMIRTGSILTNGKVLMFGQYMGSRGLAELRRFLGEVEGVVDVELHTLITERGRKCELSESHLKVLKCLFDDPRMSAAEISRQMGLSQKRVSRIIHEFLGEGGSLSEVLIQDQDIGDTRTQEACFHFRVWWDLNASGGTAFIIRINHEVGTGNMGKLVDWLKEKYPMEFWFAYSSAVEPIIFSVFVIEHMRDATAIVNNIRQAPHVISVRAIFGFPSKRFKNLQDQFMEDKLAKIE